MFYNDAAKEAEERFGEVDWNRIDWNEDGTPDLHVNDLPEDEARRYTDVANFVWQNTDTEN